MTDGTYDVVNRVCPGVLDTLIGIEEAGYVPYRDVDDTIGFLCSTLVPGPMPTWVSRGLEINHDKLLSMLRRRPEPTSGFVLVVLV